MQLVFNPDLNPAPHELAGQVRGEWVVQVSGSVTRRSDETVNASLPTGEVEVAAEGMTVLNDSRTPPFPVSGEGEVDELLRLRHRYLDLRRPRMRDMLVMRHRAVKFIRDFLSERGFLEVETPILIKSTPEGARDYLVPSRLHPGKFYALPQSPQQLKQLLMAAGVEKYFQIARCFRDEDPRGDRQPEFSQLDLEMSFADENDVLDLIERLYTELFETLVPGRAILRKPFPRISHAEAMERFASDRPDLRYGLEMADLGAAVEDTEFRVFQAVLASGGIVKGFTAPGLGGMPRRRLDDLVEFTKQSGAQGLVYVALDAGAPSIDDLAEEHVKSPVARFLPLDVVKEMARKTGASPGDLLLVVAGPAKSTNVALDALRREIARRLELADPDVLAFAFVVDFPLFEWNEDEARWDSPPPVHVAEGGTRGGAGVRPRRRAVPRLRPRVQRDGGGGRQHPHSPAENAEQGVRGARLQRGGHRGAVQAATGRVRVRHAAPRRHRGGHRAARHAADERRQHPRGHRVPEDADRRRPAVRGAGLGGRRAVGRTPHPDDRVARRALQEKPCRSTL